jgi:hypothetical protein
MQSFWGTKKNSLFNWLNNGVDFDPALTPCLKTEGDRWENGESISIGKAGN